MLQFERCDICSFAVFSTSVTLVLVLNINNKYHCISQYVGFKYHRNELSHGKLCLFKQSL